MRAASHVGAFVSISLIFLLQAACVTERHALAPRTPIQAIATQETTSRIALAIKPLGEIPYDGLTLPLSSPDGRWLVTQSGQAPDWPVLLAEPSAQSPVGQVLTIYRLTDSGLEIAESNVLTEPGVVLGRSCDNQGFLVERLLDDGSRWIGKISWNLPLKASSAHVPRVQWLVADEHNNAFATLGPSGQLAWSRRRVGSSSRELILQLDAKNRSTQLRCSTPSVDYVFPFFAWTLSDSDRARTSSLWALTLPSSAIRSSPSQAPNSQRSSSELAVALFAPFPISHQLQIAAQTPFDEPTLIAAYQATAFLQTPPTDPFLPIGSDLPSPETSASVVFSPRTQGILLLMSAADKKNRFQPQNEAEFTHLAVNPCARNTSSATICRTKSKSHLGLLIADSQGLIYADMTPAQAVSAQKNMDFQRLLAGIYLIRAVDASGTDFLLLSPPVNGGGQSLKILRAKVAKPS